VIASPSHGVVLPCTVAFDMVLCGIFVLLLRGIRDTRHGNVNSESRFSHYLPFISALGAQVGFTAFTFNTVRIGRYFLDGLSVIAVLANHSCSSPAGAYPR
jgi:hypothetical protein